MIFNIFFPLAYFFVCLIYISAPFLIVCESQVFLVSYAKTKLHKKMAVDFSMVLGYFSEIKTLIHCLAQRVAGRGPAMSVLHSGMPCRNS